MSVFPFVCVYMGVYLCVYLCICRSVYLCICLSECDRMSVFVYLCVHACIQQCLGVFLVMLLAIYYVPRTGCYKNVDDRAMIS